jgi:hypothetical protein
MPAWLLDENSEELLKAAELLLGMPLELLGATPELLGVSLELLCATLELLCATLELLGLSGSGCSSELEQESVKIIASKKPAANRKRVVFIYTSCCYRWVRFP